MTKKPIIAITSADGHIPSLVATHLVRAGTADKIKELRLLSDDKRKARHRAHRLVDQLADGKVTLHEVKLTDLTDLQSALDQVDTLLLIPPGSPAKFEIATTILRAAEDARIPNLILVSWAGTDLTKELLSAESTSITANDFSQLKLFKLLEDDVMLHTTKAGFQCKLVCRTSYFIDNLLTYALPLMHLRQLPLPVHPHAHIAPLDVHLLAECLARLALDMSHSSADADAPDSAGRAARLNNQTLTLTGPKLVTPEDIARELGRALNFTVDYKHVSLDHARELLEKAKPHWSEPEVEAILETYVLWDRGVLAHVSSDLERVFADQGVDWAAPLEASLKRLVPELYRLTGDRVGGEKQAVDQAKVAMETTQ